MSERQFDIMKNGYNRYQVEDYLDDLENRMAMLHQKVDMYRQRSEEVEKQLHQINEEYHQVVHNLSMKEKAAEEIARIAMKEANVIVDTAQMNADVIVKEALMTARSILLDISKLGNEANELKGAMYEQLKSLSKTLDAFEVPPIPDIDLLKEKEIQ